MIQTELTEVAQWLQKEFAAIRTGQATPALIDGVRVMSYGTLMPINQVANIGIEDARTLRISPWDAQQVSHIEAAIRDADLGVSLATDSAGVRVIFPELTAERRQQLVKLAKSKLEEARIRIRGIRDEANKEIDRLFKSSEISEDERFTRKDVVQKAVDVTNSELETRFAKKEQELSL